MGIVVGRDEADRRFVAHTPGDAETLAGLEATEQVGRTGTVRQVDGDLNLFVPD
jgi:acetyl-CoA C-acetyltransferase